MGKEAIILKTVFPYGKSRTKYVVLRFSSSKLLAKVVKILVKSFTIKNSHIFMKIGSQKSKGKKGQNSRKNSPKFNEKSQNSWKKTTFNL